MAAIVPGRKRLPRDEDEKFVFRGYVDMSGGSQDDACLAVAHYDKARKVTVLDSLMSQAGGTPFNPRDAVRKFAAELHEYGLSKVTGDAYGGLTFRQDFAAAGVTYQVHPDSTSDNYEAFEPRLNASEVELLDLPILQEQLLTLVWKGSKITHQSGDHDDHACAAVGACLLAAQGRKGVHITPQILDAARKQQPYRGFGGYRKAQMKCFF
jgi:hypothetical protein